MSLWCQTALQRHYGILEALALGEDEMPDIKDETLPDEGGLARYLFSFVILCMLNRSQKLCTACSHVLLFMPCVGWVELEAQYVGFSYLRPGVVKVIDEFKASVYGENYDQEEAEAAAAKASRGDAAKKRKAITDAASLKSAAYDWAELADNGKVSSQVILPRLYVPTS